jgi:hypothetical protein
VIVLEDKKTKLNVNYQNTIFGHIQLA